VTETGTTDVYYDPYDVGIDADPYPVFRRLREEAPLLIALAKVLRRFQTWEVDWDNAKLAATSTVRGWDTLPVFTS
jgi:hypothetical protein